MSGPAKCGICGDMAAPIVAPLCPLHGGPQFFIGKDGHISRIDMDAKGWKPGPAITQGPDDAGDGAALRDQLQAHLRAAGPRATVEEAADSVVDNAGAAASHRIATSAPRPTLNRHAGELAMELLRYASANSPGAQLARPLTAYETHYAAHVAAFLHHGFRQAALALEGNDEAAGEALKLAMHEARRADAARRVVIHEDAIRDLVQL